jgi:DNA topoisomerase-3
MKVCIAEKPSVAKEIAHVLGANNKLDGYFEGNGYQVTWTFGHLCTLKEPNEYDEKWKSWNIHTLPILPLKFEIKLIKNKGVEKQFRTIKHLVDKATEVINCGDAGQEGELIQRWVLAKAKYTKPMKRLWISSLTEEAIREGFTKLKEGAAFESLYHAGSSRAIGDWLLGMNATRLYTLKYGNGKQVLSIGRVQTPTLALIVNRQLEIENFKPQTYFEIKTTYREVIFNSTKGRYANKEEASKILVDIQGSPFTISGIEIKKGKEAPPRLFDLTSLQVECNKKFGNSADDTLKIIQNLYEKKLVTYPRVDTTYLSNDIYPKIPGILKNLSDYTALTAPLLSKPIRKSNKVFDDAKVTDHHAIIPTDVRAYNLPMQESQVYHLIVKRFIAVFYHDCEVSNTVVSGYVKETTFRANGKQILDPGWRIVYQKETAVDEEAEDIQLLPLFIKGESGPHVPGLLEKQTQPPKAFTEATLLRAMETAGKQVDDEELRELMKDNGIGRPSTRANIIETLYKRTYIKKERKNLIATTIGVDLIKTIHNDLLKSAELTGQWEYKLRQIEKGAYDAKKFLEEMKTMIDELVTQVKAESSKPFSGIKAVSPVIKKLLDAQFESKVVCPKCEKGFIVKGKTAIGCNGYKEGCDFKVPYDFQGQQLTQQQIMHLIQKRKSEPIKLNIDNVDKTLVLLLDETFNVTYKEVEKEIIKEKKKEADPKILVCPKCKTGLIIKGNTAYGCSGWKSGCALRVPFVFMKKTLTQVQIDLLILKGETKNIKGFENEEAQKLDGKLRLNANFEIELVL